MVKDDRCVIGIITRKCDRPNCTFDHASRVLDEISGTLVVIIKEGTKVISNQQWEGAVGAPFALLDFMMPPHQDPGISAWMTAGNPQYGDNDSSAGVQRNLQWDQKLHELHSGQLRGELPTTKEIVDNLTNPMDAIKYDVGPNPLDVSEAVDAQNPPWQERRRKKSIQQKERDSSEEVYGMVRSVATYHCMLRVIFPT